MDFQQLRMIFHGLWYRTQVTNRITSSKSYKTLSKVPQAVVDYGTGLFRMFPGTGYLAGQLKEVRDPKFLRCKSFEEVHESHREIGIMNGYRNENCSFVQAIYSLFRATNETVNFWTHFIPTLYFLWIFFCLSSTLPLFTDPFLLPFVCFMMSSCAYPLMSCLAHAFSCLSYEALNVGFFMDYATLSLYGWGVSILYYNYSFPPNFIDSTYGRLFIPVSAICSLFSTLMACSSRFVATPFTQKSLRLGAFVIPYLWDSAPLIYRLVYCDYYDDNCRQSGIHHTRQFMGVLLAAFFYGTHIPERLAPGKFDFVGNSHNLLHLFGIAATYEQLQGALIDLKGRRAYFESGNWTNTDISTPGSLSLAPEWVTIASPIIVLMQLGFVIYYTRKLCNRCARDLANTDVCTKNNYRTSDEVLRKEDLQRDTERIINRDRMNLVETANPFQWNIKRDFARKKDQ